MWKIAFALASSGCLPHGQSEQLYGAPEQWSVSQLRHMQTSSDADIESSSSALRPFATFLLAALRPSSQGIKQTIPSQRRASPVQMGRKGMPPRSASDAMIRGAQAQTNAKPPLPEDGKPLMTLYCRAGDKGKWWPVTTMPGDETCKGFVNGWLNWPIGKENAYRSLKQTMARSVKEQRNRLTEYALEMYGRILAGPETSKKKSKLVLQWGFKVDSTEIQAKIEKGDITKPKIVRLTDDMVKPGGFLGTVQNKWTEFTENIKQGR
jgi:hypothetical protein